ncbi:MAG TPA: hypothetical protein VGG85_01055 [Terracidiphilus sp.]|jgi:hypothetical protein
MNESISIWRFVLSVLALWRVTHLLAEEDGPWELIASLRSKLGPGFAGKLMDCFYCLSLWFSLPLAIWLGNKSWVGTLLQWQALSGAACLLEKATQRPDATFYPIQTFPGDEPCAVVTKETK